MMGPPSTPPSILSILLDDKIVFKLDLLFLFCIILTVTYCVGLFHWLQGVDQCLFLKAIAHGFFDSYLEFSRDEDDDSSQGDSLNPARDDEVISSEDDELSRNHDKCCEITENNCPACGQNFQATQRASTPDIDPNSTIARSTGPGNKLLSHAGSTLLSLANHLELKVAVLTQAETQDMLFELRILRSTVGSRVPVFMQQSMPPANAFDADASCGEASLIDASIWLLKKRFSGRGEARLELSDFDQNDELQKKESPEQRSEEQKRAETALQQEKQEQEQEQQEEGYGSTSSCDQTESHDDPVEPDMPSSPSSTSSSFDPVPTAKGFIFHVNYGVVDRLRDLSELELDALVVELKDHKRKLLNKRANAIVGSFWSGKEHILEVKALCDARIGLVDGIMAVIRQYNLSSESPVREPSDHSIPSLFRLGNPRERRNSF